jgi:hypothetical protein
VQWIAAHKWGIWAFAVAVAFIPHIMSSAFLPRWGVIIIGTPLVSRLALGRLSQTMQYVLVLGIAWAACSVLFAPDRMAGAYQLFLMVATIGVFIAASEIDTLDDAMTGLAFGIGLSSALCWLFLSDIKLVEQGTVHPAGLFWNSEILAEFAAPVLLWALLKRRWPLVALTVTPMLVSESRVALLALGTGLLYYFRPRSTALTVAMFSVLALAGILVVLLLLGSAPDNRIGSAGLRIVYWLTAIWSATPLGNGLGWWNAAHPAEAFVHSDALQAVNELGIGAIFLLAIPVLILRESRGTNAERAVFIAVCVEVLVSFPLHLPAGSFLAAICAGYLAGHRALVSVGRSDRRDRDAQDRRWHSAIATAIGSARQLGGRALSVRSEPAHNAALGYG